MNLQIKLGGQTLNTRKYVKGIRTYVKKAEKGRPLSRAKAHTKRDTEAKILKSETEKMEPCIRTKTVAPTLDLVLYVSR